MARSRHMATAKLDRKLLDRLLVPAGRSEGAVNPSCHPEAQLTALYRVGGRRGSTLHLYCGRCSKVQLVVRVW